MFKPTFIFVLLYILIKYLAFYAFLMLKNGNYSFLQIGDIKNGEDLFYYLWLLLFMPVICIILFSVPLYFSFRLKKTIYFVSLVSFVFIAEYFLYTYLASTSNLMNGVYNGVISLAFFVLFFYTSISKTLSGNRQNSVVSE